MAKKQEEKKQEEKKKKISMSKCFICGEKFPAEQMTIKKSKKYCPECLIKYEEQQKESANYTCTGCKQIFELGTETTWGRAKYCPDCWGQDSHLRDRKCRRITEHIRVLMEESDYEEDDFNNHFSYIYKTILDTEKNNEWTLDEIYYCVCYCYDRLGWEFKVEGLKSAIVYAYGFVKASMRERDELKRNIEEIEKEKGSVFFEEEDVIIDRDKIRDQELLDFYKEKMKKFEGHNLENAITDYHYEETDDDIWE